ncbi:MAG: 4Fe-4S binding protein, partial [Bacillota bacterium]
GRDRREYRSLDKDSLDRSALSAGFDNSPRQRPAKRAEALAFTDSRLTFTEEQLKNETARCLGCGAVQLDPAICVGCGMCVSKCSFDAIRLVRKYNAYATTYELLPLQMGPNMVKRVGKIAVNAVKGGVGAKGR